MAHLGKTLDLIDTGIDPRAGQYLSEEFGYSHANQTSFDRVGRGRSIKGDARAECLGATLPISPALCPATARDHADSLEICNLPRRATWTLIQPRRSRDAETSRIRGNFGGKRSNNQPQGTELSRIAGQRSLGEKRYLMNFPIRAPRAPKAPIDRERYILSVVIPCYNESATIAALLARMARADVPRLEVIVVDDGSTDGTTDLLRGDLSLAIDRLIVHRENRGKGAALRSGLKEASGDIVLIQDADLEYDPGDYGRLIEPILERGADVVYGSRFAGSEGQPVLSFWHMLANRLLTLVSNCFTNLNLTDMETGYKVFRREVIQAVPLRENRFGFEPEVTAKLAKSGCIFYEVAIHYRGRSYAEGKKIGLKDAVRALYATVRYSLFPELPAAAPLTLRSPAAARDSIANHGRCDGSDIAHAQPTTRPPRARMANPVEQGIEGSAS